MAERPTGAPCWIDVATPDVAATRAFYTGLLGWEAVDGPPEAGGYVMCLLGGQPVAAISPQWLDAGGPARWTTYVAVDDADETAARVVAAGGETLTEPMDVLDVGRMAVFRDPAGAIFAIWQKRSHRGTLPDASTPGALIWSECTTRDLPRAVDFYAEALGWEDRAYDGLPAAEMDAGMQGYRVLHHASTGDRGVAGIQAMPDGQGDMPSFWLPYVCSADADASAARIAELGGRVLVGPMGVPTVGRIAVASDPQGGMFGLLEPAMG